MSDIAYANDAEMAAENGRRRAEALARFRQNTANKDSQI